MMILKEETFRKDSWIIALNEFRHDAIELGIPESQLAMYMKKFLDAFKRSEDYDLAANSVFDEIMQQISRGKTRKTFKSFWKNRVEKQKAGDVIIFEGKKWQVDQVIKNYQEGLNLYVIHRYESVDGVNLSVEMKKILAAEHELATI